MRLFSSILQKQEKNTGFLLGLDILSFEEPNLNENLQWERNKMYAEPALAHIPFFLSEFFYLSYLSFEIVRVKDGMKGTMREEIK